MSSNLGTRRETAAITAQNTFTTAFAIQPGERAAISNVAGTATTTTLQRRLNGTDWRDVESWTADVETSYVADVSCDLRLGVKTGNYGSGTTTALLGAG